METRNVQSAVGHCARSRGRPMPTVVKIVSVYVEFVMIFG